MSLRDYAILHLTLLGLDGDTYVDYILQLLDRPAVSGSAEPSDLNSFLADCSIEESAAANFRDKLRQISLRGHVLASEFEDIQKKISESSNTGEEVECDDQEDPFSEDLDQYVQEVDWINLIESLESHLKLCYSWTQEFSPFALMQALYKGYFAGQQPFAGLDFAAQLLLNAVHQLNQCKPCRHLMQDRCFRKDCTFDHDLKKYPCRYWLFSVCANSSSDPNQPVYDLTESGSCLFMHDLPDYQPVYLQPVTEQNPVTAADEPPPPPPTVPEEPAEEFPSLGSTPAPTKTKGKPKANPYLSAVKSKEAVIPQPAAPASATDERRGGSSVAGSQLKGFAELLESRDFVTRSRSRQQQSQQQQQSGAGLRVGRGEWVESGDSLRQDYQALREEARQLAIARNKCLQEATHAYLSGSRSIAKSLSAQGQALNLQMKACHLQAAKAIFRNRNKLADLEAGRIDLHGLHVSEARDCLAELIPLYERVGIPRLRVVTGTGHHTKGPQEGRARLLPHVRAYCEEERGLRCQEIKDDGGFSGALQVDLRR